ncbi:MAG: hypothetical protein WD850_03345 [Candidatus Spechtbacterales bacterium]
MAMWDSLKQLLRQSGEKAVIMEDGEPRYVVLTVSEYLRMRDGDDVPEQADELSRQAAKDEEEPNEEISALREAEYLGGSDNSDVTLDDLPF